MGQGLGVLSVLRVFYFATSPIIFLVGVFLLYDANLYMRIEGFLGKTYKIQKRLWVDSLEKNRESLQIFLLKWRRIVGLICLLNSAGAFYVASFLLKK